MDSDGFAHSGAAEGDIKDVINKNRTIWDTFSFGVINDLKDGLLENGEVSFRHFMCHQLEDGEFISTEGPAIFVKGGAAYMAYDQIFLFQEK